jgi:Tol biopolymer transport system component
MLRASTLSLVLLLTPLCLGQEKEKGEDEEKGLSLEPTRKIEFITDEATWLSLDVSPDGQTLVLELLGDLYKLPIDGGEATPITSGLPFDSQPRFSPDGNRIAFLSDRDGAENVWIAGADGSEPKKLSQDTHAEFASPAWTPDGEYVLVSRSSWGLATYELWMYHIDGGTGIQVTKAKPKPETPRNQRHNAIGVTASPDGRYLYYARKQGGFQYNADFPLWQIARRDRVTGDEDVLTLAQGSAVRPVLSPDGTKLVYGTRFDAQTGLRIRDLKGGEDRWLIYPVQRDDQESRFTRDLLPGYAFTPDGKEIVLTIGGKIHRLDIEAGGTRPIPFTAKVSQELGPRLHFPRRVEQGPVRARIIQDPVPSPDGRRLAFSAMTRLYVMDLPAGSPRRLLPSDTPGFQPAWSPDGQWLAYVTWSSEAGGGGHIWKVRADGTGAERLTPVSAFYSDPAWTPDGSRIVALRSTIHERLTRRIDFGQVTGLDLIWIPSEGGDAHLVIPARGLGKPHFTRDPERVYLYLNTGTFGRGQKHGLVSLRFDGTDRRELLQLTGPGIYFAEEPVGADDIRIRPDERWALARVSNQLYLVAVPPVGGSVPKVDIEKPAVPLKKLTNMGADYFGWTDDGETITWAIGSTLFQRPFDSISFDPPKKDEESEEEEDDDDTPLEEESDDVEKIEVVIERPRHLPRGTIVLRGGNVVTMRGREVITDADLVVRDNRIAAVGRRGEVDIPAGARTLDLKGTTIVPGFVDTHAHWFEIRRGVLDVVNYSFLANLSYGVTTGLDVQTSTNDMFAYQDLVDIGESKGPRAYSTGPGIFSNNAFKSVKEARGVMSRYKDHYRTGNLKSYIVGNRKQRHFLVQAAQELEMMPTTEGALDLKLDLTHVLDGFSGNEHSLPIVPLYKDVIELVARSGIGYTPTLLVAYGGPFAENDFYTATEVHDDAKLRRFLPHNVVDAKSQRRRWFRREEHVYPKTAAAAAKIIRAGGRVGGGSHGQLQGLGFHWEMWALASGGLKPLEVLRAATLHGAEIIGLSQDLGSIEPGKMADLVVLNRNPLDDIRNTNSVRYVMKNGELFEGDTLDQIWPKEEKRKPLWWWDADPAHASSLP